MEKLTQIQNELKAPKDKFNSFGKYNYRSCESIMEALKPLLLKHQCTLVITDNIQEIGGIVFVESQAVIRHKEESFICTAQAGIDPNRKGMDIAQCFGSSSSYSRKYALSGLFLIDDSKDADATNDHSDKPTKVSEPIATTPQVSTEKQWLTQAQFDKIIERVQKGEKDLVAKVMDTYRMKKEYTDTLTSLS